MNRYWFRCRTFLALQVPLQCDSNLDRHRHLVATTANEVFLEDLAQIVALGSSLTVRCYSTD